MKVTANFPTLVWDGSSSSREGSIETIEASPSYQDWDQITAEVIATQTEVNTVKTRTVTLDGGSVNTSLTGNSVGGIPVVHIITVPASSGDVDIILTYKTRVIDVVVVKTTANGGAGDTVTVKNGSTAITNAISLNAVDTTIVRAGTINDASHEVSAGGTLRATGANSTSCACLVYIHGLRVA